MISALHLEAFYESAKSRHFGRAAEALAITPSALSQRISGLEADLEITLFIRDPSGLRLTEAGETLLRYCQVQQSLQQDMLTHLGLKKNSQKLSGQLRIAGFSSVMRSVLIPTMADFLRQHPDVHCEFQSFEVKDLLRVLRNAEADLVVLDFHPAKAGIVEHVLGQEEYVVIESSKFRSPPDLFLDHGPHDNATESFFASQPKPPKTYRRSFMGDVYGILNGVELGLGRAVMSRHLIKGAKGVRRIRGHRAYHRDVVLCYFEQPYYSALHKTVVELLTNGCRQRL
ncbi:MAG: LysR family transcriptional regulator [Bdellovibrionales bacterium]